MQLCKKRKSVRLSSVPSVKEHSLGQVCLSLASLGLAWLSLQCANPLSLLWCFQSEKIEH